MEKIKIIYDFFNDFQVSIVAIITLIATYPFLKKKLLENHISNALNEIQSKNKELAIESTKFIDTIFSKLQNYNTETISKEELEYLNEKIQNLYLISLETQSSNSTTLMFLKNTYKNLINDYPNITNLYKNDVILLTINTLEKIIYYSTQYVQIPKSTKTTKKQIINKKISKYISFTSFEKYKHFNQGNIYDPKSSYYLTYYSLLKKTSNNNICKAGFEIFNKPFALSCILFLQEIYAPLILKDVKNSVFFDELTLYLVNFQIIKKKSLNGNNEDSTVKLIYSNINYNIGFVNNLSEEQFLKNFKDNYLDNSNFDLSKTKLYKKEKNEIIILEFDYQYCKEIFKKNKKNFSKELKN